MAGPDKSVRSAHVTVLVGGSSAVSHRRDDG